MCGDKHWKTLFQKSSEEWQPCLLRLLRKAGHWNCDPRWDWWFSIPLHAKKEGLQRNVHEADWAGGYVYSDDSSLNGGRHKGGWIWDIPRGRWLRDRSLFF